MSDRADQEDVPDSNGWVKKHSKSKNRPYYYNVNTKEKITRTEAEARKLIEGYRERLLAGEDFGTMAEQYSDCSSAKRGGDLGQFGRGQMQPSFEQASFALQVDEMSGIVSSASGLHIIKRIE